MISLRKILSGIVTYLLLGFIILATTIDVHAQKERTRLKVYYGKLTNDDKRISIVLTQGSGKEIAGVPDSEILLTTFENGEEKDLASLNTDSEGEAVLLVEAGYSFPKDEKGYAVINAIYNGNDSLRSADREIKFKDLNINISFEIVDSVKQVTVLAFEKDSIGNRIPINELGFRIGVERLYSNLFLEKIETDEAGIATFEFPNDIPGNSEGTIKVVVFVEDHDDYGNLIKSANINWGTLVDYSDHLIGRSLYGDHAPLWMIIAVIVILAGAWLNFIRAIYRIVKMKNLGHSQF